MGRLRSVLDKLGTVGIALLMLLGGVLVWWNVWGQGPFKDHCRISLGCRSFYCLEHALHDDTLVPSSGYCTKVCERDADCGDGYRCVVLTEAARDDLPPLGKPDRACARVDRAE
jgi:hypothetical protein